MIDLSESIERLNNGDTWNEFCDTLKAAGAVIMDPDAPSDPLTRAEGFRYLSRVARGALEAFVEFADPLAPVLFRPVHETVKMGADNPDNYYQWARISGEYDYKITGNRGTIHYLGFGTYAGQYGSPARSAQTGYLEGKELLCDENGDFEITVSCSEGPGNWLRMEPDTTSLIVRQMFLDKKNETMANLRVECLGRGDEREARRVLPRVTPVSIDEGLGTASRLVMGAASIFSSWAKGFQAHVNRLPEFDDSNALAAHGDPNIKYYHSYWKLDPDEALIISFTPPHCDYWNFQLNNHWMESLDYRYHRISINSHEAEKEKDGSVRLVVAHRDPGHPNWIETAAHHFGTMCFRWVRADAHPEPETRVITLEKFRKENS